MLFFQGRWEAQVSYSKKGVPPVLWQHQRKVWDILFIRALEATFSNGLLYILLCNLLSDLIEEIQ